MLTIEQVARMCHQANREYCMMIGDESQEVWTVSPAWQRESAINGVKYHLLNPHVGPDSSHQNWLVEKVDAGWVWGPVKDEDKKQHPCMVPFYNLPPEQQAKDKLFKGVVDAVRELVEE